MPRKNPRPAAKKAQFKRREKLAAPVPFFHRTATKPRQPPSGYLRELELAALSIFAISDIFRK